MRRVWLMLIAVVFGADAIGGVYLLVFPSRGLRSFGPDWYIWPVMIIVVGILVVGAIAWRFASGRAQPSRTGAVTQGNGRK